MLWTGDTVPHNMDEEKKYDEKIRFLKRAADFFDANLTSSTLYPVMGNHDYMVSNL